MKRIGILTYHFVNNYGAVLQCYALRQVINKLPGCAAEIVNYISPIGYYHRISWNSLWQRAEFLEKRRLFKTFLKEKCGITKPPISYLSGDEYDYFCAGSDQVWGTASPRNEIYFFPFPSTHCKKISYAASIGIGSDTPWFSKNKLLKYLPDFSHLSVREEEHRIVIEELIGSSCECVLDPSLLLTAEDYNELTYEGQLCENEFIFFFWLNNDDTLFRGVEFVNTLSRKHQLPVIHSLIGAESYLFYQDGGCMMSEGIDHFLWYIKHARYMSTSCNILTQ